MSEYKEGILTFSLAGNQTAPDYLEWNGGRVVGATSVIDFTTALVKTLWILHHIDTFEHNGENSGKYVHHTWKFHRLKVYDAE